MRASADALPIEAGSVNVWLMSRFAFHFADLRNFFCEAARVLVPGGCLIFDVYQWTPRQWIPGNQKFIGGAFILIRERPSRNGSTSLAFG